jgi:PAS domain S-box-containing protein
MRDLQAEVLAKILLMQNLLGQLPDERSIRDFLARGIMDLPGVEHTEFMKGDAPSPVGSSTWPLSVHGRKAWIMAVRLKHPNDFSPYAPFVGNLCFMAAIMLERVAERAMAEQRSMMERGRAEFLLEVSELIIVGLDREGRIRTINRRGCELLGYSASEVMGKNWFDLAIPEPEREHVREVFSSVMAGRLEMPRAYQHEVVTRDGQRRTITWKNRAELDSDGQSSGTISAGEDITTRIEIERRTLAEKERLATTLRSIGEGVVTTSVDGTVVDMNEAAQRLTGFSLDEARGRPLTEVYRVVDERDASQTPIAWKKALEIGLPIESPAFVALLTKTGEQRPVSDSLSPIRDAHGTTHGLVLVFRDLTERRRLFNNQVRADRLEALGVMAGGIAHDFNNLLGGVFGYMDLAIQESTEPEVQSSLSMAKSVFDRAKDLTQQLLTFAKGGTPIKKTLAIGPLIEQSVRFVLSGSNIASRFHLPTDLWSCDADKNQLGQVLDNLTINAIQAMPNGGQLVVSARNETVGNDNGLLAPGEYVVVSIRDTGVGIPAGILNHIFDPFFTTKQSGSGLGLATCHSIMQRHGGAIDVHSSPGHGTTFTLWLKASPRSTTEEHAATAIRHHGSGIILVMDDEEYLLKFIARSLERMGYEVAQAKHGEAALEVWRALKPRAHQVRAAFLDLTIRGGMGGKDTAKALLDAGFTSSLFATSGYAEDKVMASPAEFGFTASISKPFALQELATFLDLWLTPSATGGSVQTTG